MAGQTAGQAAAGASGAAAAPVPFFKGLYGDDGKIDKAAFDRLPDHLKAHKDVFAKYDTVDQLLNGFGNAHALASKKHLTPLEPNAPENVRAERKAMLDQVLNVPKEAKGYGIARPENFPEEHWNQAGAEKFAALAHKHSISPDAVRELLALQVESTQGELAKGKDMEAAYYREQGEAFAAEAKKLGLADDKALDLATRGARTLGIDPKNPIFQNAAVKLACVRLTKLVAEDKLVSGDTGQPGGKTYREQALDIMQNVQNPLNKAYNDSNDPQHQKAVDETHRLYRAHGKAMRGEVA